MKCGNCKLWNTTYLYEDPIKEVKSQKSIHGKALGACTYNDSFYPRFNYEKCPF